MKAKQLEVTPMIDRWVADKLEDWAESQRATMAKDYTKGNEYRNGYITALIDIEVKIQEHRNGLTKSITIREKVKATV